MKACLVFVLSLFFLSQSDAQNVDLDSASVSQLHFQLGRLPNYRGHLNDFEKIFTADESKQLEAAMSLIQKEKGINTLFITIDSTFKMNDDIVRIFMQNIPIKWEQKNHLRNKEFIEILLSKSLRSFQIIVSDDLKDTISQEQLNDIVFTYFYPELKNHHYFAGSLEGLNGLSQSLTPINSNQ